MESTTNSTTTYTYQTQPPCCYKDKCTECKCRCCCWKMTCTNKKCGVCTPTSGFVPQITWTSGVQSVPTTLFSATDNSQCPP